MSLKSGQLKLLFHVEGIRCYSCIRKIEDLLDETTNVVSAHVRLDNSILEVVCKESVEPSAIRAYLSGIGFEAKFISRNSDTYSSHVIENRKFLNKIAVAGFSAGNIMLFTVSIYAGADNLYLKYFSWLSAILFLPILTYSSLDFYKNAMASIKNKYLSIDLPIAIALIGGFLLSMVNLFSEKYEFLYFDSTASFVFLILIVRYFLGKIQQTLFSVSDPFQIDDDKKYMVDAELKKVTDLQVGDLIKIHKNELVPIDGLLVSKFAEMNTSFLTGESFPKLYQQNMLILSGSLNVSSDIFIRATKTFDKSSMSELLNQIDEVKKEKGKVVKLADKASHYLILSVFSISLIYFLFSLLSNPLDGFQRSLALIIVACPCALALGTPLTYALGIRKAKLLGIIIKDQNVFDKLLEVKNLFFDKTGTLTEGKLSLTTSYPEVINDQIVQIILNLEKISHHPIAYAIRNKWGKNFDSLDLIDHKENAGLGVSAFYNNERYTLRSSEKNDSESIAAVLYKNNTVICELNFEDHLRHNFSYFYKKLENKFKNIFLVSGDMSALTKVIGKISGIKDSHIFSNQSPQDKYELIRKYQPALMVGDGINDALALKEAHVGVAVAGAVSASLESSDVYFIKNDLNLTYELYHLSENVRRTLITNIIISLFYNLFAGFFALSGAITPLTAAVLMPVSSIAIILNTYWRLK